MKRIILALAAVILVFPLLSGFAKFSASAYPSTPLKPLLRLNDVYVLYTYPRAPYIDKHQRLMVPLRSMAEMLGADLSYIPSSKTAEVSMNGHRLKLVLGASTAYADGKAITLESSPSMEQGSLYIPIRFLIDGLHIPSKLDKNVVVLQGESFFQKGRFQANYENDWTGRNRTIDPLALRPLDLTLNIQVNQETGISEGYGTVRAQNATGAAIDKGRQDLHIWYYLEKVTWITDFEGPRVNDREVRPALNKDEIITKPLTLTFQNKADKLRYVLAVGRTLKTYDETYNNATGH